MKRVTLILVVQLTAVIAVILMYLVQSYINGFTGLHPIASGVLATLFLGLPYVTKLEKYL